MLPIVGAVAAAGTIKKAGGIIGGIFGDQHPKDQGRLRDNRTAFDLANSAAGNRNAFLYLRQRSGKFGTLTIPPIPGLYQGGDVGGWAAGGEADEDAYKKYQSLRIRYEAAEANGSAGELPGQVVDPTNLNKDPNLTVTGEARTSASIGMIMVGVVVLAFLAKALLRPQSAS